MSITQTVEVPANRRLTIDVPPQTPIGARVLIQFPVDNICPTDFSPKIPLSGSSGKIQLTEEKMAELLADESLRSITGILHSDMTVDQIRDERLAKHL